MVHVGRPGEDGYTERVLASWGVDGHNSHTNMCSRGGPGRLPFWRATTGRPRLRQRQGDLPVSSHLETGHYFNPHAQRIIEARARGAKVIVIDPRLSNTATQADYWLSPQPGSEAAMLLAIANHLIRDRPLRPRVRAQLVELAGVSAALPPGPAGHLRGVPVGAGRAVRRVHAEFAAAESGVDAADDRRGRRRVGRRGHRVLGAQLAVGGGGQPGRLAGVAHAVPDLRAARRGRHRGGTFPNAWNKFVPQPIHTPPHPDVWNELTWPREYPLAHNEMSFLLPHFLKDGRGRLDVYFTRVYNPVWTNPDGFSWMEVLHR